MGVGCHATPGEGGKGGRRTREEGHERHEKSATKTTRGGAKGGDARRRRHDNEGGGRAATPQVGPHPHTTAEHLLCLTTAHGAGMIGLKCAWHGNLTQTYKNDTSYYGQGAAEGPTFNSAIGLHVQIACWVKD